MINYIDVGFVEKHMYDHTKLKVNYSKGKVDFTFKPSPMFEVGASINSDEVKVFREMRFLTLRFSGFLL